jgi:exoribonuclease R
LKFVNGNKNKIINKNMKSRILIANRDYTTWNLVNHETNIEIKNIEDIVCKIDPIKNKLFTKDIIQITNNEIEIKIDVIVSPVRNSEYIAGILLLENNKTFGRTENKKRLLYKCIPDDKHLPAFLIPYDIKIGFNKVYQNKYVIFKYDNWNDKHPHGMLLETLGDVDNLCVFYEYQLYCKSLHISLNNFTKKTRDSFKTTTQEQYIEKIFKNPDFNIEDERKTYVFTIDPQNSLDFDDGFSIMKMDDKWKITVYISHVYFWLETLELWNSFSKRVSTIYLPDQRRPMLPTILSDNLCSLQKNNLRFAFAIDIVVDNEGNICNEENIKCRNVLISVKKNYIYEDSRDISKHENVLNDIHYERLFEISQKMDKNVKNSHDVVSHWMITMNHLCGKWFENNKLGIFRTSHYNFVKKELDESIHENTRRVINSWNNVTGQYILYDGEININHEAMNISSYIHITSPIRRIVDLLNQMLIIEKMGLVKNMSISAKDFLAYWLNQIDYINNSMRSIRKVQTDCNVLYRCYTETDIMNTIQRGILFDKNSKSNGLYSYMIYLEELKLLSRITTMIDIENYTYISCKLYLFEDEDKIKKKIRVQIVEN